jgi:hypothetical protein
MLRWLLVLRALGARLSARRTLAILYVGYFFNQAMPSAIGGDVARVWYVYRSGVLGHAALSSVLIDRLAAIFGILVLGMVLGPYYAEAFGARVGYGIGGISLAMFLGGFAGLFLGERVARLVRLRFFATLASALQRAAVLLTRPRLAAATIAISTMIHLLFGVIFYLLCRAIDVEVALRDSVLLFPLVTLIAVLPISVAGWGVREGAVVFVFSFVGVPAADALLASVLFGVATMLVALPGGIVWIVGRDTLAKRGA